jgi:hypothetical protein
MKNKEQRAESREQMKTGMLREWGMRGNFFLR